MLWGAEDDSYGFRGQMEVLTCSSNGDSAAALAQMLDKSTTSCSNDVPTPLSRTGLGSGSSSACAECVEGVDSRIQTWRVKFLHKVGVADKSLPSRRITRHVACSGFRSPLALLSPLVSCPFLVPASVYGCMRVRVRARCRG